MWLNGSMDKRETPSSIAKQYGVRPLEIYKVMQEMKLGVGSMGAKLNGRQAEKLHTYYKNLAKINADRVKQLPLKPSAPVESSALPPIRKPRPEREWHKHCQCCELKWVYVADEDANKPYCDRCEGHHPKAGEDDARRLRRATDHSTRYKVLADRAYASAAQAHEEKLQAYRSRTKWNRALAEVVLDHEPDEEGNCWCGGSYPCRTWRKLESASKGIHKQVEDWGAMSDDQRERVLYGEAYDKMVDEEQRELERRARAMARNMVAEDASMFYAPEKLLRNMSDGASSG